MKSAINFAAMSTTFITNEKGERISAVVPIKKYLQWLEELEELADIRAYDKAKKRNEKPVPFRDAIQKRRKKRKA